MSKNTMQLNDKLRDYLLSVSLRELPILTALRDETNQMEMRIMQISPDQGQFMAMLVQLMAAKKILEVGTFTGYSALAMALALPDAGELIACDISKEWTDIAKKYWIQAGIAHKIQLHLAPALQTLEKLVQEEAQNTFDFAFIDADKENQWQYYEYCLKLLRPGGLMLVDNVLWGGSVIDEKDTTESTVAIREFNKKVYADERVTISMIPVGDGLTLARKN